MSPQPRKIVMGICGASGTIYATRLLQALLAQPTQVQLIVSSTGAQVMRQELGLCPEDLPDFLRSRGPFHPAADLKIQDINSFFAPPASGSFLHDGMVVVPCSMKTLASVAAGIAENLILRCADVCLKENRRLIIVPRETPLNVIHLDNMHRVATAGAVVLPAMPSFYHPPDTIEALVDTVVARILDHLSIAHNLADRWMG